MRLYITTSVAKTNNGCEVAGGVVHACVALQAMIELIVGAVAAAGDAENLHKALRVELCMLHRPDLKVHAVEAGVPQGDIDAADDAGDPRAVLRELLVHAMAAAGAGGDGPQPQLQLAAQWAREAKAREESERTKDLKAKAAGEDVAAVAYAASEKDGPEVDGVDTTPPSTLEKAQKPRSKGWCWCGASDAKAQAKAEAVRLLSHSQPHADALFHVAALVLFRLTV
eukprot:SAG11_NODE_116_length_16002_cov_19.164560_4_plen_226_part_00